MSNPQKIEQLEHATSTRLARLQAAPVDTTKARQFCEQIGTANTPLLKSYHWRHPFIMTAAALLLVAATTLFLIFNIGAQPVVAVPADLAQLHSEVLTQHAMMSTVQNLDQANKVLLQQWKEAPNLTTPLADKICACCVHSFMNRKVACMLLRPTNDPAEQVTIVLGRAKDIQCMSGNTVQFQGQTFVVHTVDGLNMIMTQQDQRYLCLMGKIPTDQLLKIASQLHY